jgi:hypothetical protein
MFLIFSVYKNAQVLKFSQQIVIICTVTLCSLVDKYSMTSLIWTNWEQTLVKISESLNYRSATENMFREVIKWTSHVFSGNTTLF